MTQPHTNILPNIIIVWCLAISTAVTVQRWHSWTPAVTWAVATLIVAALAAAGVLWWKGRAK